MGLINLKTKMKIVKDDWHPMPYRIKCLVDTRNWWQCLWGSPVILKWMTAKCRWMTNGQPQYISFGDNYDTHPARFATEQEAVQCIKNLKINIKNDLIK